MTGVVLDDATLDVVALAIQESEAAEIAPRFRQLAAGEIEHKAPGEVVTAADRACEVVLSRRLAELVDVPIIGEEAAAANPSLLDLLVSDSTCWLVDPLDGTSNFAVGSPDYAVMVAFIDRGATIASWIWVPATGQMYIAARGAGATCNGEPISRPLGGRQIGALAGVIKDRFLPDASKDDIQTRAAGLGSTQPGSFCAGIEYPELVRGETDYILYWRTLPWDHAPGVLLATESGCVALRPDSSAYQPASRASGLVVAPADLGSAVLRRLLQPSD